MSRRRDPGARPGDRAHRHINLVLSVGSRLHARGHRYLTALCDVLVRIVFAADIPCRTAVPPEVTFMHNGLGTVVNPDVTFTGPALVFQNVTLGFALNGRPGVPTIGSHVVIAAGAGVFGPVMVGDGAFVAAGAVVTRDVAPGALVTAARPGDVRALAADAWQRYWPQPARREPA